MREERDIEDKSSSRSEGPDPDKYLCARELTLHGSLITVSTCVPELTLHGSLIDHLVHGVHADRRMHAPYEPSASLHVPHAQHAMPQTWRLGRGQRLGIR